MTWHIWSLLSFHGIGMIKETDLWIHISQTCPFQIRSLPSITIKIAFAYQLFRMKMAADPSGAMIELKSATIQPLNQAHKGIDAEHWQMQDEICLLIIGCVTKKWTRNQNWVSIVINLLSTLASNQARHLVCKCRKAVAQNIWLHATGGPHANLMHHRVLNCK